MMPAANSPCRGENFMLPPGSCDEDELHRLCRRTRRSPSYSSTCIPPTSQKHNDPAVLWAPTGTMVLAD